MTHPSFGPVPRKKFMKAIELPAGQAAALFRQYDPLWGASEEEIAEAEAMESDYA